MALLDLTGQRFGKLTVLGRSDRREKKRSFWLCQCDCGNVCEPRSDALRHADGSGAARSCGCLQKEKATSNCVSRTKHGLSRSRAYISWVHMIDRCTNPKNGRFADYGDRGITVCPRWRSSFEAFYADMGEMPYGMTLERKDNSRGYSASNCHWATYTAQNRNRRHSIYVPTADGLLPLAVYAEREGAPYSRVYQQFVSGRLHAVRPNAE